MYKIIVPVKWTARNFNKEETVEALKNLNADTAALILNRVIENGRLVTDYRMDELTKYLRYFEKNGFKTMVWIGETIGHGGLVGNRAAEECRYRCFEEVMKPPKAGTFCPTDKHFVDDICEWVGNAVKAGTDFLLLDDDFRMANHGYGKFGCMCSEHVKEYCKIIGENLTKEEITEKVFTGGKSIYRDAWIKLQGNTLRGFAKKIREHINTINENTRIGLCATTSHDVGGTDNTEIAGILAGNTKPFVRFAGAPYWARRHGELGYAILNERYLRYAVEDDETEIVSEGDTYPRPRYTCPASYLENFDFALRADGGFDGILKYALDYCSGLKHENGYVEAAKANTDFLKKTEKLFADGKTCGINIFEEKRKFESYDLKGKTAAENLNCASSAWGGNPVPISLMFMSDTSMPVTFEKNESATLVFGENAKYVSLSLAKNGLILDIPAAKILQNRGVDIGLESAVPTDGIDCEYYKKYNEYVQLCENTFYEVTPNDKAEIVTELCGEKNTCGVYLYENAHGERFMIYPFDAESCYENRLGVMKSLERQMQLREGAEWVGRKKLPAVCIGNPYIFITCKKAQGGMAVGIQNLSADKITKPIIELDKEYTEIKTIRGIGKIKGNTVVLEELAPFDFNGFVVE